MILPIFRCHPASRLLQVSPEEARRVICAPKEVVEEFQEEDRHNFFFVRFLVNVELLSC